MIEHVEDELKFGGNLGGMPHRNRIHHVVICVLEKPTNVATKITFEILAVILLEHIRSIQNTNQSFKIKIDRPMKESDLETE